MDTVSPQILQQELNSLKGHLEIIIVDLKRDLKLTYDYLVTLFCLERKLVWQGQVKILKCSLYRIMEKYSTLENN